MNKIVCAFVTAFAASGLCVALGWFPTLFNPVSSEHYNQRLFAVFFAGNVLQGTLIALLFICFWHGATTPASPRQIGGYLALLLVLGLLLPWGSLYSNRYADCLFTWYVVLSGLAGACSSFTVCIPCLLMGTHRIAFTEHHCGKSRPP